MIKNQDESRPDFWTFGGRAALVVVLLLFGFRAAFLNTGLGDIAEFLAGIAIGAVVIAVGFSITGICSKALQKIPNIALTFLVTALLASAFFTLFTPATVLLTVLDVDAWKSPVEPAGSLGFMSVATFVLALSFIASLGLLIRRDVLGGISSRARATLLTLTGALTIVMAINIAGLFDDGEDPFPSNYKTMDGALPSHIAAPDPSLPGSFGVTELSYGAGENLRRPKFGSGRDIESRIVDASPLLPEWKGFKQRMRETYWGFGLDAAPLNGLLWMPEGKGPFPLALIVHGNHGMEDFSDPGYAYLGELLASRGIIAVSVDQNYINATWSGDFQGKEMPARAWLLLEHLRL
ncbi:MAG: hypothetical protein HOM16_14945, partial [Woeseia sp.]|nr:hypothetical protein [Woeseia sp.]